MDVYIQIIALYKKRGYHIAGGEFPWHFDTLYPMEMLRNYRSFPFMSITKGTNSFSVGGGISPLEVILLVAVIRAMKPKRVFIIGNAFGWSTLALGLADPHTQVLAIDSIEEGSDAEQGFALTQEIIKEEGLKNITLVQARSPEDISHVVKTHFDGPIDLALIDGLHTNQQQYLDFCALQPVMAKTQMIFLHDVLNWELTVSYQKIRKEFSHLQSNILMRTPSGMGVFYSSDVPQAAQDILNGFTEESSIIKQKHQMLKDRINNFIAETKVKITKKVFPKRKMSAVIVERL